MNLQVLHTSRAEGENARRQYVPSLPMHPWLDAATQERIVQALG